MKRLLRAILPASAVSGLVAVRRGVDLTVAWTAGALIKLLPLRTQAVTKGRLDSTGVLDYPRGPIRMVVDSEAELPRLRSCFKEPETVAWIEEFVRSGDVLFDIGANVGAYSLVADRATAGRCTVYAFEPSFSTFTQLSRNVALNGAEGRIIPVLVALSDVNGLVTFNYSSIDPGAALHALGESLDSIGRPFRPVFSQPVLCYRMDDFIAQFAVAAPNHIKLDVDGVELKVLRGASGVLANPRLRTVLVEVEPARPERAAIEELLAANGFAVHGRYPHGPTADSTTNLLFTRGKGPA
ncbi:MAG TPA: FkbM family methyltransferase [Gemmatimonadales bacterium]